MLSLCSISGAPARRSSAFCDGGGHAFEAGFDYASRHGEVEADIARGVADEERIPALEQDPGLVRKEARQILLARQAGREVDPGEIRGLGYIHPRPGQELREVIAHKGEVRVQILPQRLEPGAAGIVGRLRRGQREGVHHAEELVALGELRARGRVAYHDVGEGEARHVEALGRRHAGDKLGIVRHYLRHRRVRYAAAREVAMYLVGDNPEVIFLDNLRDTAQLLLAPDAARGIVRVAPVDELGLGVRAFGLEILVIHGKEAVFVPFERRGEDVDPAVLRRVQEVAVGRRVEHRLLVRRAEVLRELVERGDDAGREAQLLAREVPAVALEAPAAEGVIIPVVVDARVPEYPPVEPRAQGVDNLRRAGKFHVRHPHAHEFLVLVGEDHLRPRVENVAAEAVRVQRVRPAPVDYLVKVVHLKPPVPKSYVQHILTPII